LKKHDFIRGASLLAISVVIAKILGAVYRIPLANIIGAQGMGLYQFVYPVFALILTLSSGAVPTAISLVVSESEARGDAAGAKKDFTIALKICLIAGMSGTLLLLLIAYPVSLLQSKEAFLGYLTIAPAVFIVTVISAFRGFFAAKRNMLPYSISQITEGIVKLAVGLTAAYFLAPYGEKYAVAGALLGVGASELVTLILLFFTYIKEEKNFVRVRLKDNKDAARKLVLTIVPLLIGGIVLPLSQFADSLLFVNLLKTGTNPAERATSSYGVFSGVVTPIINLPIMVCISLGIAITPQMAEGKIKRDVDFIMDKATTATKIIFAVCVPFALIFIFLGDAVINLLYPNLGAENIMLGGKLLAISAVNILTLSVFQIYSAILQGLGKITVPVKVMGGCVIFKTILSCILIPFIGMTGAAAANTAAFLIAAAVIMAYFFRYARVVDDLAKNSSLITLCGAIMSLIIVITIQILTSPVSLILAAGVSILVYAVMLFVLRVFTPDELKSMPLGGILVKIDAIIHK